MWWVIPKSKAPFGSNQVIKAVLNCVRSVSVSQVETAYANKYEVPYVILLPSARAGICWALQECISLGTPVICPVYTCSVVWEAVVEAGGELNLIDAAANGFLMDETTLRTAERGSYAIILCEIYGYTYNLSQIAHQAPEPPLVRIVDMAMTVPSRELLDRLNSGDFAVTSFGSGKCMYAGWGGVGFTRNKLLADKVRRRRDSVLKRCTFSLLIKRSMKMTAQSMLDKPLVYEFSKKMRKAKRSIRCRFAAQPSGSTTFSAMKQFLSKEYFLPTTYIDRQLMLYNLEHAELYCQRKKILARRYHDNFEGVSGIIRPDVSPHALSHYTIRVNSGLRPLLRNRLEAVGIDAGTLFFFPSSFSKNDYPHASQTASEVLNLPLDVRLTLEQIDWISERVVQAIEGLIKSAV